MIVALQALLIVRNSLVNIIERYLGPLITNLLFLQSIENIDDEDIDDEVFAEFDDEKGVIFYPPVYAQRYAAVSDCLLDKKWRGKLEKIVDFGCHDMSFIKYLKDIVGVKEILGVDIETIPLNCSASLKCDKYIPKRESPLKINLFQGNAADPDYRLVGCDAVVAIELIEHMQPHDLDRFIHNVFGFIKPWVTIITTPNGDFNHLFKALEKNGLRRLDHMFEWTREQFHDWCSNIVARYPGYTVSCKGVGPGPSGTSHLGCCSQLAIFVAKDYHKQTDLNLNSLALVTRMSTSGSVSDMGDSWDSHEIMRNNMLCAADSISPSLSDMLSENASRLTFVITAPSIETIEFQHKMMQCNLDYEFGKNFLMFDDEMYFNTMVPRQRLGYRVYDMEDVCNRLNCTSLHVKKFSKTTHILMAKNKMDALVHTREVVDEIRHLSKMLNLNRNALAKCSGGHTWCNINWGENAPYWNQYYTLVRDYNYPFEVKSNDSRILELISEDINRLIDDGDGQFASGVNKMEIPLEYLMRVVSDVTDDEDKVRDLLEWNGYDVVDDRVIYSRLIVDDMSEVELDHCREINTISDWAADPQSTTISEDVPIEPDTYERILRRALDQKIFNLRKLKADEDLTTELDRVVCRLMKLALGTSRGLDSPPPSTWLLYKLYDLLTLTENAILKRKKHCLDEQLKAIEYSCGGEEKAMSLRRVIEETMIDRNISKKYQFITTNSDDDNILEYFHDQDRLEDFDFVNRVVSIGSEISDGSVKYRGHGEYADSGKDELCINNEEKTFINYPSYTNLEPKRSITLGNDICKYNNAENNTRFESQNIFLNNNEMSELLISNLNFENKFLEDRNDQVNAQSKLLEPISECLIEQYAQLIDSIDVADNFTSETKESVFMKIVIDGREEKIAFRRSIGTDPEIANDLDSNVFGEKVINITIKESATSVHTIPEDKKLSSIFLYDIDEPSTSEGVRHYSTDVQCGPDVSSNQVSSSVTTSTARISNRCATGIRIEDSVTNIQINKKEDFCSTTNMIDYTNGKENHRNYKASFMKYVDEKCETNSSKLLPNFSSTTVTELVKPIFSVIKTEDSSLEMCDSTGSFLKSSKNGSSFKVKSLSKVAIVDMSPVTSSKSKLSYSGVHVHSFKDKRMSEDIVYQGDWQTNITNPKAISKKKRYIPHDKGNQIPKQQELQNVKSIYHSPKAKTPVNKHLELQNTTAVYHTPETKSHENKQQELQNTKVAYHTLKTKILINSKKSGTVCNPKINTIKKTQLNVQCVTYNNSMKKVIMKTNRPAGTIKYSRRKKSVTKVSSKKTTSILGYKKSNPTMASRKPFQTSTPIKDVIKKEREVIKLSSYIPPYLKKRIGKYPKQYPKYLNSETGFNKHNSYDNLSCITLPKSRNKDKHLYMFSAENRRHDTYFVYRNDAETNLGHVEPESKVPLSNNTSPCSSPTSVVTVRKVSVQNIVDYSKLTPTSSEKSTSNNYMPENVITKTNKIFRESKIKKPNISLNICDNKENISDSSKNYYYKKPYKGAFLAQNKNVYMTRMSTETTSAGTHSVCNTKFQTMAKPTTTTTENNIRLNYDHNLSNISNKMSNEVLATKNIFDSVSKADDKYSHSYIVKVENDNSVEVAIKSIIEEKLIDIEKLCTNRKNIHIRDSHIHKKDVEKDNDFPEFSQCCNIDRNPEESLSAKDITKERISSVDLKNIKSISTVTDLLSFKSFTSGNTSKHSEYFLADDEINKNVLNSQVNNSIGSLLQNNKIIRAKDQNSVTSVQTNKHSIDAQSIFKVRPELINYVDSETGSRTFPLSRHEDQNSVTSVQTNKNSINAQSNVKVRPELINYVDSETGSRTFPLPRHEDQNSVTSVQTNKNSINAQSIFKVRPELINYVDSETGSRTFPLSRHETSEELFVSDRSSEYTYDSGTLDEELFVPEWLYATGRLEPPEAMVSEIPLVAVEPQIDMNANVMEPGVGAGAGAGDGRGMHSDMSQESSGRGTSLSSTETSSGQESQVVLSDQSANGVDNIYVHAMRPSAMSELPHQSLDMQPTENRETRDSSLRDPAASGYVPFVLVNGVEGDVSSLDTVLIDSDDN